MARKQDAYYFDNLWHVPRSPATQRIFCGRYLESSTRTTCRNTWRRSMRSKTGADGKKHDMLDKLAKEFIPPIEREDIVALSQQIDTMTDKVEDVLMRVYMSNVQEIEPDALERPT